MFARARTMGAEHRSRHAFLHPQAGVETAPQPLSVRHNRLVVLQSGPPLEMLFRAGQCSGLGRFAAVVPKTIWVKAGLGEDLFQAGASRGGARRPPEQPIRR